MTFSVDTGQSSPWTPLLVPSELTNNVVAEPEARMGLSNMDFLLEPLLS